MTAPSYLPFRVLLNQDDSLIIYAPSQDILQTYLDHPGDQGYRLFDILISLYHGGQLQTTQILPLGQMTSNDTILAWNRVIRLI